MDTAMPRQTREILEASLLADPNDITAHMAYAHLLTEEGDPRGELINLQLALENLSDETQRSALLEKEADLLMELMPEILPTLDDEVTRGDNVVAVIRRGWLDLLEIHTLRSGLAQLLAEAPEIRMLQHLAVVNRDAKALDPAVAYRTRVLVETAWFDADEEEALVPLLDCPYLGNVRVFKLGDLHFGRCDVGDGPIYGLLQKMPKLEELQLFVWKLRDGVSIFSMQMPNLKKLWIGGVTTYPLEELANNPSLVNLEDLLLQPASPGGHKKFFPDEYLLILESPHFPKLRHLRLSFLADGDQFCEAIVETNWIRRLFTLELRFCDITDAGAARLAEHPDIGLLESLDLTGNPLSVATIQALRATGVLVIFETLPSMDESHSAAKDDDEPEMDQVDEEDDEMEDDEDTENSEEEVDAEMLDQLLQQLRSLQESLGVADTEGNSATIEDDDGDEETPPPMEKNHKQR